MYLKRVELHGFKSFAERVEIEFGPGINAIVGPNGSGKSNITDAIRWVLGEQSVRNLRGSKLEDVIFAGSNKKKPMGMAEVSITLDNSDNLLPLQYSEICFTRRIFRSGESEFYVNKAPCRLKDIQEILMDTGIGKDGYSIIGQGQVDEILTGRAEERRVIFEETAGIMKHKARKKEAERRLEETVNNITRIDDILGEIQNQLIPLKEQKDKALEYKRLLEQLKELDINLLLAEISGIEKRANNIKASIEQNQTQLKNILQELNVLNGKSAEDDNKLKNLEKLYETYQKNAYDATSQKKDIEKDLQWAKDEEKRLGMEHDELLKNIDSLRQKISEVKNNLEHKIKDLEGKIKNINGLELEIADGERQLALIEANIKKKEELIENLKSDVIDLLNYASEKKNVMSSLSTMRANLENRLRQIQKEILALDKSNESTEAEIQNIKQKLKELNEKAEDREKDMDKQKQYILLLDKDLEVKRAQDVKKGEELSALISRFRALKEVNENYEGYQFGVKNLLSSIKNKRISGEGIYGTLADIISVEQKYEIAIETALGGALQNIVCDTEENAKRAIEFLKMHDMGRVTFLPLRAVKPRGLSKAEEYILSMKGCIGPATSLVICGDKFLPIIENLLGRVVVVDTMESAIACARKCSFTLKIVTLDGELFNPGGAITGGSHKKAGLILARKRELNEFEEKIERLKFQLNDIRQQCLQIEEKLRASRESFDSSQNVLYDLKSQKAVLEKQLQEKQNVFDERQERKRQLETEIEQIKIQTEEIETQRVNLQKDIGHIDDENISSQAKVRQLQEEINDEKSRKEGLAKRITDLKIRLASQKQEELNTEENIQKMEKDISDWSEELKDMQDKLLQNELSDNKMKDKILFLTEQLDKVSLQEEKLQERLDELKKQRESLILSIESSRQKQNLLEEKRKMLEKKINDYKIEETAVSMEHIQVKDKLEERYSLSIDEALNFKKDLGNIHDMKQTFAEIQQEVEALGLVNLQAIEDYDNLKSRFDFLKSQRDDLQEAKLKLDNLIGEITRTMEDMFLKSFEKVKQEFKNVFVELFGGGRADLIIEGDGSVLEAGIDIIAQPPGKKLQSISLLSGGEKALTAIALLFAILNIKATPFCILDEIEAALDDANIDRFATYLRKVASHTQFIIITHRKNTMTMADALYGIAMEDTAVSKVLAVKLD